MEVMGDMNAGIDGSNMGRPKSMESSATPSGHTLSPSDPDSPMNWPLWKKLYTSLISFMFTFTVVYGTTTYTAAIPAIPEAYNVSMRIAILGFTLPFFGVFFAPIYTPHLSERHGRRPVYLASFPLFLLCVVVIGIAKNKETLLAFRFLAGLAGGPCLVLIEGTFADIWSAEYTVTYYSFLTMASFFGAAFGPIIGNFVLASKGPAWLSWVTLFFGIVSLGFGAGMPETYGREILRKRHHYNRSGVKLPAAPSGVTFSQMAHITFFTPLKMLVTDPLVIMITLYLGLNFAVVFQWFISVPAALGMAYGFDGKRSGLAFLSAVGGVILAAASSALLEVVASRGSSRRGMAKIETRLFPAMVGSFLIVGSLFWVGHTAMPDISYYAPIFGTAVYVWGNAMVLISLISYLFDAYPPAGTLSALTAAACFRLACAGVVPIFILDMITDLGGDWAFGTLGIISAAMLFFPFMLYIWGPALRERSKYGKGGMTTVQMEMMEMERKGSVSEV